MELKESCLDDKYRCSLLLYCYKNKHCEIHMSDPLNVVSTSYRIIRSSFLDLRDENLITIDKQRSPRRVYRISLTERGEKIAYRLLEIEEILL